MRKKHLVLFMALLLCLSVVHTGVAMTSGFTHPEIGELLTVTFEEGLPSFSIYDFPYYVVADPANAMRDIKANFTTLPHPDMMDVDTALERFYQSLSKPYLAIYTLVYTGVAAPYADALNALPLKERIEAIKLLNGFGGAGGYEALKGYAGFEQADVAAMAASHMDYHVKIGDQVFPYRVLPFHFEGEDWVSFTERYAFLQVQGEWKLSRTATEYTDDYLFRGKYIHGITGSEPEALAETNGPLLRDMTFGMTPDQVAALENVPAANEITVPDVVAFRIPATLHYAFGKDGLEKISCTFDSREAYFSAFLSLYMRYSDPVTIAENYDMTWSLNDMLITLTYDEDSPVVSFQPY